MLVLTPSSVRRGRSVVFGAVLIAGIAGLSACSDDGREMRAPSADQNDSVISIPDPTEAPVGFDTAALDDESLAEFSAVAPWVEGGVIPEMFTCTGGNVAPTLSWSNAPDSTASFAVVLIDTTMASVDSVGFVHHATYNIDPTTTTLDPSSLPAGAIAGPTDFGAAEAPATGWSGPCPPIGTTHTYVLEVHALDQMLESLDGATAADVVQAIDAATIATASITASVTGF